MNQHQITKAVSVTTSRMPQGWVGFVTIALHNEAKQTLLFPDWPRVGGMPSETALITNCLCDALHSVTCGDPTVTGGEFGRALAEALHAWRHPAPQQTELLFA